MTHSFAEAVQFLVKGGPVMVPLLAASLVAVTVMIERIVVLGRAGRESGPLMDEVRACVQRGAFRDAIRAAEAAGTPVGRVLAAGLHARRLPPERLAKILEEAAKGAVAIINAVPGGAAARRGSRRRAGLRLRPADPAAAGGARADRRAVTPPGRPGTRPPSR